MSEKNLALVFGPVLDFIFLNVKSFKAFRARCEWFLHGVVYDRIYPGVKQGPLTESDLQELTAVLRDRAGTLGAPEKRE